MLSRLLLSHPVTFVAALLLSATLLSAQSPFGLRGYSFDTLSDPNWLSPPDGVFDVSAPSATFVQTSQIYYSNNFVGNVPGITSTDTFGVLWEGWLDVRVDGQGLYTFYTDSDDGSAIYLDLNGDGDYADAGELVVDNRGVHARQTRQGDVELNMNSVRIAIAYYEESGDEIMGASYSKNVFRVIYGSSAFSATNPLMDPAYAGLWVGQASLDEVKEVATSTWSNASAFDQTILLHVDETGEPNLLSEATIMQTHAVPPVPVVVTDPEQLSNFDGVIRRGGHLVGQRFSSSTVPLSSSSVRLSTGPGNTLSTTISLSPAHPLNPFRHKYHPDLAVGRQLERTIRIQLTEEDSPADHTIGGTLLESVAGIHKDTIEARGPVTFTRVSTSGQLR